MSFHISPEYAPQNLGREAEYQAKFIKFVTSEEATSKHHVAGERLTRGTVTPADAIYCSVCGRLSHYPAKFCLACGIRLGHATASMDRRIVWLSSIAMTLVFIMAIALYWNQSTREAWGTFFALTAVAAIIAGAFFVLRRIMLQAGYPGWLAVLIIAPPISALVLLFMAVSEWPVSKRIKEVEAECASLRRLLAAKDDAANASSAH